MLDTSKKDGHNAIILGVTISGSTESQVLKQVAEWIDGKNDFGSKRGGSEVDIRLIFTPNPEILTLATRDLGFRAILNSADINIPDGVGIVYASLILRAFGKQTSGQTISSTLTGTDLGHSMVMMGAEKGWHVFYLGGMPADSAGRPAVAEQAGMMLEIEAKESGRIYSSDFAWMAGRPEDDRIVDTINDFGPDLLLVAMGQGKQERWLATHKDQINAKVGMVVGGAVDFWSGNITRAPRWVSKIGLEWLYRLVQEPWRWRRQLRLFEFVWLIIREALKK